MNAQWCADHRILYRAGFIGMFVGHLICVLTQFVKIVLNLFVTDINSCMETGKIYIYPVWIFRFVTKEMLYPGLFFRIPGIQTNMEIPSD